MIWRQAAENLQYAWSLVEKNLTAILTGDQSHLQLPVSPPVEEATSEPAQEEKQEPEPEEEEEEEPEEEEGRMQVQEQELEPIPEQQQKSEVTEVAESESKQPAGSAEEPESVLIQEQELVDAQRQKEHVQPSQLQQHEPMDVGIPAEGDQSEPTQPVVGNVIKSASAASSAEVHCAVAQPPSPDSNSQQKTVSETKRPIPNKSPTPTAAAANPLLPPVRSQLLESSKTASTWLAQRLEQRSGGEDERRVHAHILTHSVTNN